MGAKLDDGPDAVDAEAAQEAEARALQEAEGLRAVTATGAKLLAVTDSDLCELCIRFPKGVLANAGSVVIINILLGRLWAVYREKTNQGGNAAEGALKALSRAGQDIDPGQFLGLDPDAQRDVALRQHGIDPYAYARLGETDKRRLRAAAGQVFNYREAWRQVFGEQPPAPVTN